MPDFATTYLLPFIIGFQKAKELFYLGDRIPAKKAFEMELGINKVLPHNKLMEYSKEQAMHLIPPKGQGLAIKLIKKKYIPIFEK